MHKLLDINENYGKDIMMHYSGSVVYDRAREEYMLIDEVDWSNGEDCIKIFYMDTHKATHTRTYSLKEINENIQAVSLMDGYVNLNGYCVHLERNIDGKFKKTTTLGNTQLVVLGTAYARINRKRTKSRLDAYICLKALKNRYYTFREAVKAIDDMFSVALSPSIALVKQPVEEGKSPVHMVYHDLYLGELVDDEVKFVSAEVRELVIDQIKELGYAA